MQILKAKVEKLLITMPFGEVPKEIEKMEIMLAGVKYDRHFGMTRLSDVRTARLLPKGVETINLRGITIVSSEDLKYISEKIGTDALPDDLEANITLSGVDNLTKLPIGTFIKFPRQVILFVTSENMPCVIPAQNMIKRGVAKEIALKFPKAGMGKRGLTAMPYASGFIKVGDEAEIYPPQNFE